MFARAIAAKEAPPERAVKVRNVRSPEDSVAEREPEGAFRPVPLSWDLGKFGLSLSADTHQHSCGYGRAGGKRQLGIPPLLIQAKLEVGAIDDPLENEADRAAAKVTGMSDPVAAIHPHTFDASAKTSAASSTAPSDASPLQRKPAALSVSRASSPAPAAMDAPLIVHQVLRSPGHPLDQTAQDYFEPRFGYDFSRVRVHSDTQAAESARAVNAHAYTVGDRIAFAAGRYAPHTNQGRGLLAHELAHVVQQGRSNYPTASQGKCEQDAHDAAHSIGNGHSAVVRTSALSGTVQRQGAPPLAELATQKKARLVRIERYWRSDSARAFFQDGSNEEVTFVDTSSLDPTTQPEGEYEKVMDLTIDRSSSTRPHVEIASHAPGSKVRVVTRPSPADRISKLPANVRGEVSEAFLNDTENGSNPETMEFAADMGDRLKETSGTTKIQMQGRDPQTLARMQAVDQWVGEQKSALDKVGAMHRAKFTQLLSDIRQVGVTGNVEAEDLSVEDIKLVLAGVAGGKSDFQTFGEFKRVMGWKLLSGKTSLPEEDANNPDFAIRNEYRRAWKAEAAGLRKMSKIAEAAQYGPLMALGASAVVGATAAAVLPVAAAAGERASTWLASKGISASLLGKTVGYTFFAKKAVDEFVDARDEARAAGIDPNSPSGIVSTVSTGVVRATGVGELGEAITDTSINTGKALNQSPWERIKGGFWGAVDVLGTAGTFMPESPGELPTAADSRAAEVSAKDGESTVGPAPAASPDSPNQAALPEAQENSGRVSASAELHVPGPHPFFKNAAANENIAALPPQAQVAEVPLAETGTEGSVPAAHIAATEPSHMATVAGGPKVDPAVDPVVEKGINEYKGPQTRPRKPPLRRPASNAASEAARAKFKNVYKYFAKKLGLPEGGQVHHAIELQVLDRFPGVFTEPELNSLGNMRGVPPELEGKMQLHQSKIREVWNRHYREIEAEIAKKGLKPGTAGYRDLVRRAVEEHSREIDHLLGQFFSEEGAGRGVKGLPGS